MTWPTRSPGIPPRAAPCTPGSQSVTGSEDRQWLYPAMTRGTDANLAFVFTKPARARRPGTCHPVRPRTGPLRTHPPRTRRASCPPSPRSAGPAIVDPREPIAVLADVLGPRWRRAVRVGDHGGRNLANADHLGVLNAIWAAETRDARDDRYRRAGHGRAPARLPAGTVPPG